MAKPRLVPFCKASDVMILVPQADEDTARLAVEVVSSRIRDHVRWQVDQYTDTYTTLYRRRMTGPLGGLDPALADTENRSRGNEPSIVLPCLNLTNVANVTVDDRVLGTAEWDATTAGIVYLHGVYPTKKASVTYTAGWVREPEDEAPGVFKDVCLGIASELAGNPEQLRAYVMGGDSESFTKTVLSADDRLDNYRVDQ